MRLMRSYVHPYMPTFINTLFRGQRIESEGHVADIADRLMSSRRASHFQYEHEIPCTWRK